MPNSLLSAYHEAGYLTGEQVLEAAGACGPVALHEAKCALAEAGRQQSAVLTLVSGDPPGKNVCAFIRSLSTDRSRVVVVALDGKLAPGSFEELLRAQTPDLEAKLRVLDGARDAGDAVAKAVAAGAYKSGDALEVLCGRDQARSLAQRIRSGDLDYDPTVLTVTPTRVPSDELEPILAAVENDDEAAQHRLLDPHLFSSKDVLDAYRETLFNAAGGLFDVGGSSSPESQANFVQHEGRVHESSTPFTVTSSTRLYHTTTAQFKRFKARPTWFTPTESEARQYEANMGEEGAGSTGPRTYVCQYVGSGPIATNEDAVKFAAEVWGEDPSAVAAEPMYSRFDGRIGEHEPALIRKLIQRMQAAGYGGVVHDDYAADQQNDAFTLVVFNPARDVRIEAELDQQVKTEALHLEFLTDVADDKDAGHEVLKSTVKTNRKLLARRGVDISGARYLGTGNNGSAWQLKSGKVLKITTDDAEAHVASHIKGQHFKHVFSIYDVWAFPGQVNGHHIYGLVTEGGLEKPSEQECTDFDWMVQLLESVYEGADDDLYAGNLRKVLEALMKSPKVPPANKRRCLELVRSYDLSGMCADMKRLGYSADLHSGNFMVRPDGTYVIIDIGTGGDQEAQKPPMDVESAANDIEVETLGSERLYEFGTGAPGSGASGPATMRGSNSSSWSTGVGALKMPSSQVPEDENSSERDQALDTDVTRDRPQMDWGPGRRSGASY